MSTMKHSSDRKDLNALVAFATEKAQKMKMNSMDKAKDDSHSDDDLEHFNFKI